ncbi:hypothetical protein [Altererythrobacter sp. ZODW24]|uniref:hypothetical protein n=1 Tax=Altererythrobacter sp. ZODW24 TaxID=2185142 RepID=UPI0013B416EB|nr:hypothetical protein [Altererythrobacter sp. ZODW24]
MVKKRSGMKARDLIASLETDFGHQVILAAKTEELADTAFLRRQEQKRLLDDLAENGVVLESIDHLLGIAEPDERIYPVLFDHLQRQYSPWLHEWIGRAFGKKSARPIVWDELVNLIRSNLLEASAADGAMIAISAMARSSDVEALIDLISDHSLGERRIFLVSNLMRSKAPRARTALIQMRSDPELSREINARLGRSRI